MDRINYSTAVWDKNLESSMTIVAEKGRGSISTNALEGLKVVDIIEKIYQKK
jgi:hypothetical protein